MAEPLSIASGTIGVVAFGIQTTDLLVKFYTTFKNQDADVVKTTRKLKDLQGTFRTLEGTLRTRHFQSSEREILSQVESAIEECDASIQELQDELNRFQASSSHGPRDRIKAARYRVEYPFRQSTLNKLDQDVGFLRGNLSLAIDALQLSDSSTILEDQSDMKATLENTRVDQVSAEIRDWLDPPDASIDFNKANNKRHPGSGSWFIKNDQFKEWLTQPNSFIWLHGFAGCGKSVLCSTAIQYALRLKQSNGPNVAIVYFYYSFNDELKQDTFALLRTLLTQLARQATDGNAVLKRLYDSHKSTTPPDQVLIAYLRDLMKRFERVYLFVDALDESPLKKRGDVLNTLQMIRDWSMPGLHFLITSRYLPDIRDYLDVEQDQQVVMRDAGIDEDIRNYVAGQLRADPRMRKWEKYRDQIQETLCDRAKGV